MFTPKFTLSPKLFMEIAQIERLYGQIEALKIPQSLELNLQRDNMVQSSYASNKIEGNPLTLPEVTNLLLDDRVPTNRSEKEVVNYFEILKTLPQYVKQDFSLDLVKEFNKRLLDGVDESAGRIRNVKVVIGKYREEKGEVSLRVKHDPPFHTAPEISASLEELLDWLNHEEEFHGAIRAGLFHHQFVYIHPFEDGNGRVCRLLTALIFMKASFQINRYFILDDYYDIDRHQYSDALHSADEGDASAWLKYFSEGVKYSMQSALSRLETAMKTLPISRRPTPKEQNVLELLQQRQEVTSTDIAEQLGVTRQQSHNLLRGLVEKGLVGRKGTTKSSYYFLK
jgi:Fic family protein